MREVLFCDGTEALFCDPKGTGTEGDELNVPVPYSSSRRR